MRAALRMYVVFVALWAIRNMTVLISIAGQESAIIILPLSCVQARRDAL